MTGMAQMARLSKWMGPMLVFLGGTLLAGCEEVILPQEVGDGPIQNFEFVWKELDRHYSLFQVKGVDWDSIYREFRPQVESDTPPATLFSILAQMLDRLRDGHVGLENGSRIHRYNGWYEPYLHNFDWEYIWYERIISRRITASGRIRYGWMTQSIAYVQIPSFAGYGWASEIDDALEQLPGAQALILDIRDNTGGRDTNAEKIAGRFARERKLYRRIQYRNGPGHDDFSPLEDDYLEPQGDAGFHGPVAVLTNRRTFSAAESFVLAMNTVPGVVMVGDTTGGGSGNPIHREMPNGWTFTISRWIERAPDGSTHEGEGLAPDIPAFIPEGHLGNVDHILSAAIRHLADQIS